ncbi:peptidase M24 [Devosia pacifica]|uniref:Peptidase M24 n=1 Tax=Devosia pacifica TaxID=1335967 RepID=A0A918VZ72_9HYPH|nr:M23 family metallopeptidase [Devosia pacifica]GHA37726.1 peptidase M24 [Devosia pacifica]
MTVQSTDGEIPSGRELSFAWLSGTVLTGVTSLLLMGAALYVAFQGQDTFSTAYKALHVGAPVETATAIDTKTSRARPITRTRSDLEVVEAGIREVVDGRVIVRNEPFVRIRATLATAATSLSQDVPRYDPVAILQDLEPERTSSGGEANTDLYGAEVEGEMMVRQSDMPASFVPARAIGDAAAARFVRATVEAAYSDIESGSMMAYASMGPTVREIGIGDLESDTLVSGIAENVTVVPKTTTPESLALGRTERILTIKEPSPLVEVLRRNGFTDTMIEAINGTLRNVFPSIELPRGARLRILFGPARNADSVIPYRMSIYLHDQQNDLDRHAVTVALTDNGKYVIGLAPPEMDFPDEDTEEVNVATLPSVYRSIWETGRKHDLSDETIQRIVALYAYDVDLTRRIAPGDSIEILKAQPDAEGHQDLLYVGLTLGDTTRKFYRFVTPDGAVDYYGPDGETGKRFLMRRPLEGGGRVASRFGYRVHPIFKSRRLHTGTDLAAPSGTPIYSAGDGVVAFAGRQSGYGNKVEIEHVNGYETGYAHMRGFAEGMRPGVRVRQGQLIGYVGSTGYSTGPHLHFEIKINGNFVDALSVKLPRENALPEQYRPQLEQMVAQVDGLMNRDAQPMTIASN